MKPTTWIIIGLVAAILIVVIVKAVQKSAEQKRLAEAQKNQTTLALAALAAKQQQAQIWSQEHGGTGDWLSTIGNVAGAVGSIFSGVQLGGKTTT